MKKRKKKTTRKRVRSLSDASADSLIDMYARTIRAWGAECEAAQVLLAELARRGLQPTEISRNPLAPLDTPIR